MKTLKELMADMSDIRARAQAAIGGAIDQAALRQAEIDWLGRKGQVTTVLRALKDLATSDRQAAGAKANELKQHITGLLRERRRELAQTQPAGPAYDPTAPGTPLGRGHLHPVTLMMRHIWDTFSSMGYSIVDGPELVSDVDNFRKLNMPPDHPARDSQDTFYVGSEATAKLLLRTHTTASSISQALSGQTGPVRILSCGKCFRRDATDRTHNPMFHQFDGIVVGPGITMADLKGTLHAAMRQIMEADIAIRFRVSYFPFTEPSAEFDLSCTICGGQGCATCKQTGWLEMGGCGMIHPQVLKNVGLDPTAVSGLAFGFGVERPLMIKHRIDDIRLLVENDQRFLQQFTAA